MIERLANSVDSDQTPHTVASDLGLHCLLKIFKGSQDYNGFKPVYIYKTSTVVEKTSVCCGFCPNLSSGTPNKVVVTYGFCLYQFGRSTDDNKSIECVEKKR